MELSNYGYWIDRHANIHPVTQKEEHGGVVQRILGDKKDSDKAALIGWIRVTVYKTDGLIYFEYQEPPSLQQMLALRRLSDEHELPLYDDVQRKVLEAIRPRWFR